MKEKKVRRSQHSYGKMDRDGFIHRSWMKSQGYPDHVFDGRPIIGICNTWSELTPCNSHLREIAEYVKRGVWEAGGFPLEFPVTSLGETQMRPTAMLYRNLLAMDVEESIRANPIDGVVLLGGCDKTSPAQLMGAASVDLPTIVVSSGPMLSGHHQGKQLGSGTDVWRLSEAKRAGEITTTEFHEAESAMSRSVGTCNTMGSASSFACIVEAMGLSLPENATLPAVDARRRSLAHLTGNRIVQLVESEQKLSNFLTEASFINAIRCHAAVGGSSNSVIHLLALARRVGVELALEDFDRYGDGVPLLVDLQPSGKFLMEDFHYAGGIPAVLHEIKSLLLPTPSVSGINVAEQAKATLYQQAVICSLDKPAKEISGAWIIKGNLCPNGALIKPSAASSRLLKHQGKAVVFEDIEDFKARIDDPDLDVDADSILVLKGCGPKGYPGMPEVGNMPLPKKLLAQGVTDMLRISDARMSGTAYGTVLLHVAPESSAGGPLAIVQSGDIIEFNAYERRLHLAVSDDEIQSRLKTRAQNQEPSQYTRGYAKLYIEHVTQADQGCDFDFLEGASGSIVTRESH